MAAPGGGENAGKFAAYYICRWSAPGWEPCNTLITSKDWYRKHENPLATGQKWYCPICETKYKTKYGMLVELKLRTGEIGLLKAPITNDLSKDIKFMSVQQQHSAAESAQDLFDSIPSVEPIMRDTVFTPTTKKGVFRFRNELYQDLPELDWNKLWQAITGLGTVAEGGTAP